MRTLLRTVGTATTLTAILLGAHASPVNPTTPITRAAEPAETARYVFDEDWCFDYGSTYDCTVSHGMLTVTITPDGREMGRITYRELVRSFSADGAQIGQTRTNSFSRTVFAEGGQDGTFSVEHTRAAGDFGTCTITYLFKIVDYELQMERYAGPGCN